MKGRWQKKRVGDLCIVVAGQSPEGQFYNSDGIGMPFYQGKKEFGEKHLRPPTTWTSQITKVAQKGDILMSVRAPVGPVNFATHQVCIGRGLAAIRSGVELNIEFLFYQFLHMQSDIGGREGAVFASINKSEIEALQLAFAPLPEQQRIVAILDEAFEGIATTKANTDKNLQNARALFMAGFEAIASGSTRGNWARTTVAAIASTAKGSIRTGPFGSQLLHSEFVDAGIAVLGIDNVVTNRFQGGKGRFITAEKYQGLRRYRVHPGDVLITIMGTCGRCAIVPDDIPEAINTKHLCCITLDRRKCLPAYLHAYFLYHPIAQDFLTSQAKGSIMAGLNMEIIKALPVLLPPMDQQREIVDQLAELSKDTQSLESLYRRKYIALDDLKASLLHQAFSGNL